MNAEEVRAVVEAEIGGAAVPLNAHGIDLNGRLVPPRKVTCRDPCAAPDGGRPLSLWVVLDEGPGNSEGYLVVFDDRRRSFGLACKGRETPTFIGYYGSFLETLEGI